MIFGMIIKKITDKGNNSYRQSIQRDRILELLKSTMSHPTADWIYGKLKKEFPKLSPGTVYRNLGILSDLGKVKKIGFGSTFDRYEANLSQHYHLICEECGSITDIVLPECKDLLDKATELSDFKIREHQIEFYGTCKVCLSKK